MSAIGDTDPMMDLETIAEDMRRELASSGFGGDRNRNYWHRLSRALDRLREVSFTATAATPEVVLGDVAQELPEGSAIVDERDIELGARPPARVRLPGAGHMPSSWTGPVPVLARRYRVLYRAPEPPKPLAVGDVVASGLQLETLPVGTLLTEARHGERAMLTAGGVADGRPRSLMFASGEELALDNLVVEAWPLTIHDLPETGGQP